MAKQNCKMRRIQLNAATLYLEKKAYTLKEHDAKALIFFLGISSLIVFLYFLKFFIAF